MLSLLGQVGAASGNSSSDNDISILRLSLVAFWFEGPSWALGNTFLSKIQE